MLHTSQGNIFHLYWGWHLADWFKNSLKIHALLLSLSCELLACGLCLEVLQRSLALCTMIGSNNQPLSCNRLFNFCCKKWCFEYHNMYTTMLLQWQWNKVYYSVCNNFSSLICCVGAAIKQYFYSKRCMYPTASKRNVVNYTISISSNCGQPYEFLIFCNCWRQKSKRVL